MPIQILLQRIVSGLAVGSMYSLVALGHVLIWNAMGILNFAHGELVMLGAFLGLTFHVLWGIPFPIALILVGVTGALIGGFLRRTIYYYLYRNNAVKENYLISSIGVSILIINIALLIWGSIGFSFPDVFGNTPFKMAGVRFIPRNIWIFAIAVTIMIVLNVFLGRTKLGRAMRAAAQDKETASMIGINVDLVDTLTFGIAAMIGSIAGVLLAPAMFVTVGMGQAIGLKAFAAAVIGGFTNISGAILGGVLLGVLENILGAFVPSNYKDVISFVVMILVLIIVPKGILGGKGNDQDER